MMKAASFASYEPASRAVQPMSVRVNPLLVSIMSFVIVIKVHAPSNAMRASAMSAQMKLACDSQKPRPSFPVGGSVF